MTILASPSQLVRAPAAREIPSWQAAIKNAVRDPAQLCQLLRLPPEFAVAAQRAGRQFPLFAPREYIARMRPGDPHDPLLRQVLPLAEELVEPPGDSVPGDSVPGDSAPGDGAPSCSAASYSGPSYSGPSYSADPVGDCASRRAPGLLRKYRGRALLLTTGACAVHCRYCFRRHYPYDEVPRAWDAWAPALAEIAADATVTEVLLSGGDPLTLVDGWLAELAERLAAIGHLRRLRVHTRLPIVIPQRVCDRLLAWLRGTRLTPIVVVHANHPAELDAAAAAALARLVDAGVTVLNQSVLLRGVNDRADVLAELCERLVDLRVMPYYLHQLDRVVGAAHFEVPVAEGRRLVRALRERLPGYAVPRYVRETAGRAYKIPLG
jgi:EF-P beta-lysylation protein EpmB